MRTMIFIAWVTATSCFPVSAKGPIPPKVGPPASHAPPAPLLASDEIPIVSYEYSADGYCASMVTCRTLGKNLTSEDLRFLEAFFPKGPGQNLRDFAGIYPIRACGILTNCQE
jgi:hypothetical protein